MERMERHALRRDRFLRVFVPALWIAWGALRFCPTAAASAGSSDGPGAGPAGGAEGAYAYSLEFSLQVTGSLTLLSRTRFCSAEELSLQLAAEPAPGGWLFRSAGLDQAGDRVNFGIGEGPRRHQRYVLLSGPPSEDRVRTLEALVVERERLLGCSLDRVPERGRGGASGPGKKAFFNYYLLENPAGSFRFEQDPQGKTSGVVNDTRLRVLLEPGGRRANPRFFELLEYALLCVPPFSGAFVYSVASEEPVQWEMACRPILEGLVRLVKNVYGRKMTLLGAEGLAGQKVLYQGRVLPGTRILRARAAVDRLEPVPIRVSGFKGKIWIESFRREVTLDLGERRVLKDAFEISFGIVRDAKVMPVFCDRNAVRVVLQEEGLAALLPDEASPPAPGRPAGPAGAGP